MLDVCTLTFLSAFCSRCPTTSQTGMTDVEAEEAGPSEPAPRSWLQAVDNTYAMFEQDGHRKRYGSLAEKVKQAVWLCEEVLDELRWVIKQAWQVCCSELSFLFR